MKQKYNKLVRDNVPLLIEIQRKKFKFHQASDEEYRQKLKEKLVEEVNEFVENPCIEELADIQEVLNTILYDMQLDDQQLLKAMFAKTTINGAFKERFILEWVKN